MLNVDFAYTERVRKNFFVSTTRFEKCNLEFDFNENQTIKFASNHIMSLYIIFDHCWVSISCTRDELKRKTFVCKKNFKKCNLRISIAFERIEMMKNRSQLMFCVRMSQAAIQKQNYDKITWCDYNHVMWSRWLCIERINFDSSI